MLRARKSGPTPDNSVLLLLGDQQQPRGSLPEGSATYNRRQPPGVRQVAVASGACGDGEWKGGTEERRSGLEAKRVERNGCEAGVLESGTE